MKKKISIFLLVLGLALGLAPSMAAAHGVWVAERASEKRIVLGEGPKDEGYDAAQVKSVMAFDRQWNTTSLELHTSSRSAGLVPAPQATALALVFEDGYWSQGRDEKWLPGSRLELGDVKKSGHYI